MKNGAINILIIDNNAENAKQLYGLFNQLEQFAFKITTVNKLKKASSLIKENNFDGVLVNITSQAAFDASTIKTLLSLNPHLAIIALTDSNNESASLALEKGAKDYLFKENLNPDVLRRSICCLIECKNAEDSIINERHKLQTILDSVDIGMFYMDEEGIVKQANRTARRWISKTIKNINACRLGDYLNCVNKGEKGCGKSPVCSECPIENIVKKVLATDKPVHDTEVEANLLIGGKPEKIWFEINVEPMKIEGKKNVILTINDITKRKEAEIILKRDKDTFERLVKEKSRDLFIAQIELDRAKRLSDLGLLSATVAHELRNPLAAIEMASYNLKRKVHDPAIASHIKTIETKVEESEKIISNLLFYSRIKPPKLEQVSIDELIGECINLAKKKFSGDKISIISDLKPIAGLKIELDPLQIREVFENILNNAFESLKNKEGKIEVRARKNGNYLETTVKDNGEGMEDEILEMVFSPFFTTKAKGTGLGLTVCRQIIQLHGGTIEILSKKHKGTTIIIKLPINYGQ